jgi:PAS domain S-box-containing protein
VSAEDRLAAAEMLTTRQGTETALSVSYERLKQIIDNAPVLLAYCDTEHRFKLVNAAYSVRFGMPPDEFVGRTVREILGEETWERIRPYREKVLTGVPVEYEIDVEPRPGVSNRMWAALNPHRNASGAVIGYVAAIVDVTDRRRIVEMRDLLAAIVESSSDAIVSVTPEGYVTSWNAGASQLFGYTAEEMQGRHISLIIPPEIREREARILQRLRAGERIERYETARLTKDGRRLDVSLTASPIRDHAGRIIGASKVARDITERKLAETALMRSEEALREADRRKDEFLAVLAHELRNPLAPLVNGLELLRRSAPGNAALTRTADMMERQLSQLVRLVDDLLDVSRITRGRVELRRAPVAVRLAVESALESCATMMTDRGLDVAVQLPGEQLLVEGDFARLSQVFANLLSNSTKYTDRGGKIRVQLERQGDEAVVCVSDTGIGIPREALDQVFDMFSQVKSHQPRAQGGLGIGLALVRSLVEMHGGKVEASSEGPGRGSTFTVRLPLMQTNEPAETAERASPSLEPASPRKRRILIADDNLDAAESLALLLEMQGHQTRTAGDGFQAVQLAESFRPDIIFMDVGMPRLDGLEAARQIRQQPWGKSMLIVALTGWGQEADRHRTRDAGIDLHLVKPITLEGIAAVLAHS